MSRFRSRNIYTPDFVVITQDDLSILSPQAVEFGAAANSGTFTVTATTAYFVYLCRIPINMVYNTCLIHINTAAASSTWEIGLFSTPSPPNGAGQTLTKIVSTSSVDSITSTGFKKNTSPLAAQVPQGSYLWAGTRFDTGVTPSVFSCARDCGSGRIQTVASSGVFSSNSSYSGGVVTDGTAGQAPSVMVTSF